MDYLNVIKELKFLSNRKSATHIMDYLNVIKEYSNKEFIKHFRLNRTTADYLIACIEAAHITSEERTGREKVTPDEAIYITLWYLSNIETFRHLADRFNKRESTIYNIVKKVTHYFSNESTKYITWPTENHEVQEIVKGFYQKQKLDGVLGAIDGSHIKIRKAKVHQEVK
ncbi:hypothetical protein QE152_g22092 [Popillia japonica]|uniref:Nuclease HARBI1 n=1 Tax=Popillia japonica TaxID=7064 RepID=A0AAW1KM51_POPJA